MKHLLNLITLLCLCLLCGIGLASCSNDEEDEVQTYYYMRYRTNRILNTSDDGIFYVDIKDRLNGQDIIYLVIRVPADKDTYHFSLNETPEIFRKDNFTFSYFPFIISHAVEYVYNVTDIYNAFFTNPTVFTDTYNINVTQGDYVDNSAKSRNVTTPYGEFRTCENDTEFDIIMNENSSGRDHCYVNHFNAYRCAEYQIPQIELIIIQDKLPRSEQNILDWF